MDISDMPYHIKNLAKAPAYLAKMVRFFTTKDQLKLKIWPGLPRTWQNRGAVSGMLFHTIT